MTEENQKTFKLYDFMNDERFKQMDSAVEYVDYFMTVKQDILVDLEGIELAIANTKLHLDLIKADTLLNTDFKGLYGKDNEGIRKTHFQKENEELLWVLKDYQITKSKCLSQLEILDDMINANLVLMGENTCKCGD